MEKTVAVKDSRHIDALVAVSSLNWNWFRNVRDPNWHSILDMRTGSIDWELVSVVPDEMHLMGYSWDWKLPKFSTDMSAVWTEVERLVECGHSFDLKTDQHGRWIASLKKDSNGWIGSAKTPPLAICKAILAMNQICIAF